MELLGDVLAQPWCKQGTQCHRLGRRTRGEGTAQALRHIGLPLRVESEGGPRQWTRHLKLRYVKGRQGRELMFLEYLCTGISTDILIYLYTCIYYIAIILSL